MVDGQRLRSLRDLANIAHEMEAKRAALRVLEQSVDTSTSAGKAFFGMLAVFAQMRLTGSAVTETEAAHHELG
jgi:DNA invertase Pin-like site-specific DNA recombinase